MGERDVSFPCRGRPGLEPSFSRFGRHSLSFTLHTKLDCSANTGRPPYPRLLPRVSILLLLTQSCGRSVPNKLSLSCSTNNPDPCRKTTRTENPVRLQHQFRSYIHSTTELQYSSTSGNVERIIAQLGLELRSTVSTSPSEASVWQWFDRFCNSEARKHTCQTLVYLP